jgi:hypothetical protein
VPGRPCRHLCLWRGSSLLSVTVLEDVDPLDGHLWDCDCRGGQSQSCDEILRGCWPHQTSQGPAIRSGRLRRCSPRWCWLASPTGKGYDWTPRSASSLCSCTWSIGMAWISTPVIKLLRHAHMAIEQVLAELDYTYGGKPITAPGYLPANFRLHGHQLPACFACRPTRFQRSSSVGLCFIPLQDDRLPSSGGCCAESMASTTSTGVDAYRWYV